jgi:hypothetical protein
MSTHTYSAAEPPSNNIQSAHDIAWVDLGIFFVLALVICPAMGLICYYVKYYPQVHPAVVVDDITADHPEPVRVPSLPERKLVWVIDRELSRARLMSQ